MRYTTAILVAAFSAVAAAEPNAPAPNPLPTWDRASAAHYLDSRQTWWMNWGPAQRDHATVCVSCHTAVPYAMARPALRQSLGEHAPSAVEQRMLAYVTKRVAMWDQVQPFYTTAEVGPGKTPESRGTEAVLNALVLTRYDAQQGRLRDITRKALGNMWATQLQPTSTAMMNASQVDQVGSWDWLNFHNAPWESDESHYYGATLAAIAVGLAPGNAPGSNYPGSSYKDTPAIQPHLKLLADYLLRDYDRQPLVNKVVVLWASSRLPALLPPARRAALLTEIQTVQQPDGGWSLATLGQWKRHDDTPLDPRSDGYATGLTVYALRQSGLAVNTPEMQKAIAWLDTHQDAKDGLWPAWSLNKRRDPSSDVGRFMSDAATSYAVMALASVQK